MKLTDDDLVALCRYEVEQAQGYDADVLATKREQALKYYHGLMAAAGDGRSNIVSKDVADVVHNLLAEVEPILQTSLIQFEPNGQDDEPQAQLESDYVRRVFDRCGGWKTLYEANHDALLIGNGWLKTYVDDIVTTTEERYPSGIDEDTRMAIMEPRGPREEITVRESGDMFIVTRQNTERKLVVKSIAPDDILYTSEAGQFNIDELRMVGQRVLYTASQLKEMGLDDKSISEIPDSADDYWPAQRAREGIYQDDVADNLSKQDAERLKECFDLYIRIDIDESGESELYNVMYGGGVFISKEKVDCHPYTTGSPVPMPHRVQGTGCYELFGSVQEAKTNVLRSYVDNLEVLNSSRLGVVDGDVNPEDLTQTRINGVIRMKHAQAVVPLPAADAGPQALTGLNYLDQVRSQRGGATVDMAEGDAQLMASSATAAAGLIQASEKMAGWYARNLANGLLADTFRLIHYKLRTEMPDAVMANLRGKWVETAPGDWIKREVIEVTCGMTTTERNNKIMGLRQVIEAQMQIMNTGGGGILTDMNKVYGAMSDWIRAADLGQPEEYLIDPSSEEAMQAAQQKDQQAQQAQQAMQAQNQQILQLEKQLEEQKMQLDKYKHDTELRFKYYDVNLDAEVAEAKMTVDNVTKLQSANSQRESSGNSQESA